MLHLNFVEVVMWLSRFPGGCEISVNYSKCCREIIGVLFPLEERDCGTLEEQKPRERNSIFVMMFQSKSKCQVCAACEVSQLNNYLWKLEKYSSSPQILGKKIYAQKMAGTPVCAF